MKARTEEPVFHVRRCHVCGAVNESKNQAIRHCGSCGKHLAPFYYFDESQLAGIDVSGLHLSLQPLPCGKENTEVKVFQPLWGFSAYW